MMRSHPVTALQRRLSQHNSRSSTKPMSTALHTTQIADDSSTIFLHGLLGNGKNLTTLAKRFGGGCLVDLPGHGRSPSGTSPHTFENCANDVLMTVGGDMPTTTIVGHSFGGRVALECAVQRSMQNDKDRTTTATTTTTTWLLDTVPGQANESVEKVIDAVQSINPTNFENRQQISNELKTVLDAGLSQWLTSSMTETSDGGLTWGFDINVVNALMPEFGTQDLMGKLEHLISVPGHTVHLVRGGKNTAWTVELVSKLQNLSKNSHGQFHVHTLPKAGHWVHTDDLPGLVKLWNTYKQS